MEHFHIKWEDEEFWIEVSIDKNIKYATRQIVVDADGKIHLSCFEDCLAEGVFDILELDGEISKIENSLFEEKWLTFTKVYFDEWEKIKQAYPIGSVFNGKISYYYPQGIIVKNDNAIAIINKNCKNSSHDNIVNGKVVGFDDVNLWLKIQIENTP